MDNSTLCLSLKVMENRQKIYLDKAKHLSFSFHVCLYIIRLQLVLISLNLS